MQFDLELEPEFFIPITEELFKADYITLDEAKE